LSAISQASSCHRSTFPCSPSSFIDVTQDSARDPIHEVNARAGHARHRFVSLVSNGIGLVSYEMLNSLTSIGATKYDGPHVYRVSQTVPVALIQRKAKLVDRPWQG
jgi:hypothetical protein